MKEFTTITTISISTIIKTAIKMFESLWITYALLVGVD